MVMTNRVKKKKPMSSAYRDLFESSSSDGVDVSSSSGASGDPTPYLMEDPNPIVAQKYVLLSFVEPRLKTYQQRELFVMRRFLRYFYTQSLFHNVLSIVSQEVNAHLGDDDGGDSGCDKKLTELKVGITSALEKGLLHRMTSLSESDSSLKESDVAFSLATLEERYLDYRSLHYQDDLLAFQKELGTGENVVEGIKFRGAFATLEEAGDRAEFLRRHKVDSCVDIFASEGFKWIPRQPDPFQSDMKVDYGTDASLHQLNLLMKTFKDMDQKRRDEFLARAQDRVKSSSSGGVSASAAASAASAAMFHPDNSVAMSSLEVTSAAGAGGNSAAGGNSDG